MKDKEISCEINTNNLSRFNIKDIAEFYGSTEGNSQVGATDNIYVACYSNPLFIYYDSILNLFTFNVGPLIKLLYYSLIFIINIRLVFLMVN